MLKHWTGKNVNLELLTTNIGGFFKEREFNAVKEASQNSYQIVAADSPHFKMDGGVSVTIEGQPNDFSVDLDFCGEKAKLLFGPLTMSLFGGGYYYLRRLKTKENWIKLEKEFWNYVDNVVLRLTNSAGG